MTAAETISCLCLCVYHFTAKQIYHAVSDSGEKSAYTSIFGQQLLRDNINVVLWLIKWLIIDNSVSAWWRKMAKYCLLQWGTTGYDKHCQQASGSLKCVWSQFWTSAFENMLIYEISVPEEHRSVTAPGVVKGWFLKMTPETLRWMYPFTISSLRPVDTTLRYVLNSRTDNILKMR